MYGIKSKQYCQQIFFNNYLEYEVQVIILLKGYTIESLERIFSNNEIFPIFVNCY